MRSLLILILIAISSPAFADFNTGDTFGKGLVIQANGTTQSGGGRTLNFASGVTVVPTNNTYQITASGGGSGNIGIGTTNLAAVYTANSATIGPASNLYVVGNNVGIGSAAPQDVLVVNGTTNTNGIASPTIDLYSSQANALNKTLTQRALSISSNSGGGIPGISQWSNAMVRWTNGTAGTDGGNGGLTDTALARNAAGVVEINNGTAGTYRDIQIRAINPVSGNVGIGSTAADQALTIGSNTTGLNADLYSTLGAEQAATLVAGNWTQGTGWASPIAGSILDKNADGTGTNTPSAATNIVSGTTYQISITVSVWSVGSAVVTLGGGQMPSITAATTYTKTITASSTAKLVITPTNTSRFTISAISIKPLTASTGTLTAQGGILTTQPSAMNTINITTGDNKAFSVTDLLGTTLLDFTTGVNGGNSILKIYGNSTGNAGQLAVQSGGWIATRGSGVLDVAASNGGSQENVLEVRAANASGGRAVNMDSTTGIGWQAATAVGNTGADTAFSRLNAGNVGIGTGNPGLFNGGLIANNIGIGTLAVSGGALVVTSGNVGIGSVTPGQIVDVNGNIRERGTNETFFGDDNKAGILANQATTPDVRFMNNAVETMRTTNGNNVGIGTVTATSTLVVHAVSSDNGINMDCPSTSACYIKLSDVGVAKSFFGYNNSDNAWEILNAAETVKNLIVPDGGNVGIGIAPGSNALEIYKAGTDFGTFIELTTDAKNFFLGTTAGSGDIPSTYYMYSNTGVGLYTNTGAGNTIGGYYYNGSSNKTAWQVAAVASGNAALQLMPTGGGNVGIGTANPSSLLDIGGNVYLDRSTSQIIMKDTGGTACTKITTSGGVISGAVVTCP